MRVKRILVGGALALVTAAQEQEEPQGPRTFQEVVSQHRNLTRLQATLEAYPDLSFMLSAVSGLTVLAPSDEAFDKLGFSSLGSIFEANDTTAIRNILAYHVLNGTYPQSAFSTTFQFPGTLLIDEAVEKVDGGQKVAVVQQSGGEVVLVSGLGSRSSVRRADLNYTNGLLHIIDSFLVPPQPFMNTSIQFNATAAAGAITKAELEEYVETTPDLTIFAPNNAAFERIGSGLANMSVEELGQLLRYHVVNGTVGYSSSLQNNTVLRTAQGNNLTIRVGGNALYVNSAQILQQDLLLSNGVLHIIENVLNYNNTQAFPDPAIPTQGPVIAGTSVTEIPFTSDLPVTATPTASIASGDEFETDAPTATGDEASAAETSATSTGSSSTASATESSGATASLRSLNPSDQSSWQWLFLSLMFSLSVLSSVLV